MRFLYEVFKEVKKKFLFKFSLIYILCFFILNISFAARIKDISNIRGVRSNQLVGYGLVVGLSGTGDGDLEYTSSSLQRMLNRLGVKIGEKELSSQTVASVILTATLPPFARSGNKINITVHALGNAKSLRGGTLVQTPLRAADEQVYVVAQGAVSIGSAIQKEFETVGFIPNGGIVEKDIGKGFLNQKIYRLQLHHPDFTTAARVTRKINTKLAGQFAKALDAATVDLLIPPDFKGREVEFISIVESLSVSPDTKARVVINEKTGSVVVGKKVTISSVAISYGGLALRVGTQDEVKRKSFKNKRKKPSRRGRKSLVLATKEGETLNERDSVILLDEAVSVEEVVKGLNHLGVQPKDLVAIFQNIQSAGALQGELEIL